MQYEPPAGDSDAIAGSAGGWLTYLENAGGVFTEQVGASNPFDGINVGSRSSPAVVDWNGDGCALFVSFCLLLC